MNPVLGLPPKASRRASYTRELLSLNRDLLLKAWSNALTMAWATLQSYVDLKRAAAETGELKKRQEAIQSMHQRTVWKEMIRQRQSIPALQAAFDAAPEALAW
ncbi:hypothetical protein WJU23_15020 [Prosthecobacter sp. SYSU 5D2]|uniref:hypothetical protein n=1 Tax=Prosthecobacter sp. SYSU 5D2 TaxID=3134134 RepID=UPI0031FEB030